MNTTIQVALEEYNHQQRAIAALEEWLGGEVSALMQHDEVLFEYRGHLGKKQDGVYILRAPGVSIQIIPEIPGVNSRYTTSASEDSISIEPRPGQAGYRITLTRKGLL